MRKLLALIIITTIFNSVNAQKIIRIEFNNKSTGDYDLMILNSLIANGYQAYVQYDQLNNTRNYDFSLKYETKSRENYDELHEFRLKLFNKDGVKINEIEKTISYINLGVNESKELNKATGKLFNETWKSSTQTDNKEVKFFNITFNVHKIDSAQYAIIAKGAAIRSVKDVENAFLKKAKQYLNEFDFYFENSSYSYSPPGGTVSMTYTGVVVYGIIKPISLNKLSPNKIDLKPENFDAEFNNKFVNY